MKLNQFHYLFGIIFVAGLLFLIWGNINTRSYYSETQINENLTIKSNETIIVHNGSEFEVKGNLNINGKLKCSDGPLRVKVTGNLTVNGEIECLRKNEIENVSNSAIDIIANNKIDFKRTAKINANSHVQITNSESDIATNKNEFNNLFEETKLISDFEQIGPLIANQTVQNPNESQTVSSKLLNLISNDAQAQEEIYNTNTNLSGLWDLNSNNSPFVKDLILNVNLAPSNLTSIKDFELKGPHGSAGDKINTSCSPTGENGENAYRALIKGGQFIIENSTINLSNGGDGGDAETEDTCSESFAQGGKGGYASNFKITGEKIEIKSEFKVVQGQNGNGGNAIAKSTNASDSCSEETGGNATAIAGQPQNFENSLFASTKVNGNNNIILSIADKPKAGTGEAKAGDGSNGNECGCNGGTGGNAEASGSTVKIIPGHGGNAGTCADKDLESEPGNGGQGGNATIGSSDEILEAKGGTGGKGSNGCPEGFGGIGGIGLEDGINGEAGKNTCETSKKFKVTPQQINKKHSLSLNECPNSFTNQIQINSSDWKIIQNPTWIEFKQLDEQTIEASYNCSINKAGNYQDSIKIESKNEKTEGQKRTIQVSLEIVE